MSADYNDLYFFQEVERMWGCSLQNLITPIETENPAGVSLRHNGIYSEIKEARRYDDSSLPLGVWSHELKKADWGRVSEIAVHALANKSKDLQLTVWLLEAQVHEYGFHGIAPCIYLMRLLCEKFWTDLYPKIEEDDLEYRTNAISWINEKLVPVLRLIPITASDRDEGEYSWSDWEMALRNEQLRDSKRISADEMQGPKMQSVHMAIAATSTEFYVAVYNDLVLALYHIELFEKVLDDFCGEYAPSLQAVVDLLGNILLMSETELFKRGVQFEEPATIETPYEESIHGDARASIHENANSNESVQGLATTHSIGQNQFLNSRATAYAVLEEVADYLLRENPHSPVPYLIRHAVQWGNMDTSELYQELFVKSQGKIDIFDILGVEEHKRSAKS